MLLASAHFELALSTTQVVSGGVAVVASAAVALKGGRGVGSVIAGACLVLCAAAVLFGAVPGDPAVQQVVARSGDYPAAPYPGSRPDFSFVELAGGVHRVDPDEDGWAIGDRALDGWLSARDAAPIGQRVAVLAYGSNACPSKIDWLRAELGLRGPVIALRAHCTDLAAVWAAGRRVVDDQRPATLCAIPGAAETHAVWLATDDQLAVLDRCEGRGVRYQLATVRSGRVELDDGSLMAQPLAYVAEAPARMPLLVDGAPVRCATTTQSRAMQLTGVPANTHGLDVTVVPR